MKNSTKAVSITMPLVMFKDAESRAKSENRTFSEFIREAIRMYNWERDFNKLNSVGRVKAERLGIKEEDIVPLVRSIRKEQSKNNA